MYHLFMNIYNFSNLSDNVNVNHHKEKYFFYN